MKYEIKGKKVKRLAQAAWLCGVLLVCAGLGANDSSAREASQEDEQLQNAWKEEQRPDGSTMLVSKYPAPVPFSINGEPEAILSANVEIITPGKDTLEEIVKEQVRDMRKSLLLDDYEEQDGRKPVKGIAVWYEDIHGTRVAFIKYRARGLADKPTALPMTAIHSLCIKGNRIILTQLIVRFAGHQDEVRHDQRVLIRVMIENPVGKKKD
jgi:hypothetical protein